MDFDMVDFSGDALFGDTLQQETPVTSDQNDAKNNTTKRTKSLKLIKNKRNKTEGAETCTTVSKKVSFPFDESPILMRFLFTPIPQQPKMNAIESFPGDVITCINSANFPALATLLNLYLDENCEISISYTNQKLSSHNFVAFSELLNEVHPDRIMSGQKMSIDGNEITTLSSVKFTDCKPLYNAVAKTVKDPTLSSFFPASRAEILKRKINTSSRPEAMRQRLETLLESDSDLVIYGSIRMVLVTDKLTHKGVNIHLECDFNSVHVADVNCY